MTRVIELNQKWSLGKQLGKGGFAEVYLGQSDNGEEVAIKLVPKGAGAGRELLFEDLSEVPNIVPVIDRGEWNNYWVIVMPKAELSLRDHIDARGGTLSVDEVLGIMSDVVEALAAIGGRVVHRDIKPANILLLNGRWCLADFGIARYAEVTTAPDTHKFSKTPAYAAPEQWREERATTATDVYALGVVAYEALAGRRLFEGPDYRRQHLGVTPEEIPNVPVPLQSLIEECLFKGPEARPTPQKLLQQLKRQPTTPSEATKRLQEANAVAVKRQTEQERQDSAARSEAERRQELYNDAQQKLRRLSQMLGDQISLYASAAKHEAGRNQSSWTLNDAILSITSPVLMQWEANDVIGEMSFEVVAYSAITITQPPSKHQIGGYAGRSHSLWFCDAHSAGVFRWYETAFMRTFGGSGATAPFSMAPLDRDALIAIGPALHTHQLAWPFVPIDQGDENAFIQQWIEWFGYAAQRELRYPSQMPERETSGSYRRNGELHISR